jgi:hypothetical protein
MAEADISMDPIAEGVEPEAEAAVAAEQENSGMPASTLTSLSDAMPNPEPEPEIRVETESEALERRMKYAQGAGSWSHGSIKAAYEVCPLLVMIKSEKQWEELELTEPAPYAHAPRPTLYTADNRYFRPDIALPTLKYQIGH